MELNAYILIAAVSVLLSANRSPIKSKKVFGILYFSFFLLLSAVVRMEFDTDILTYATVMGQDGLSLYYIREPFVWLGQRYVFDLTESTYGTFLIFDMFLAFVFYSAAARINLPQYAYFSFLIFFPVILGMQNVYRQFAASIFLLDAISRAATSRTSFSWVPAFVFAVLSHNVAILFAPVFFSESRLRIFLPVLAFSIAASAFWIPRLSAYKSAVNTGADLGFLYVILIICLFVFFLLRDRLLIDRDNAAIYRRLTALLSILMTSYLLLPSGSTERIGMMALIFLYPEIAHKMEARFKQKPIVRILLSIAGFLPMFAFSTSHFIT